MNLSMLSSEIDLEPTLDRLCGDSDLLLEILDLFLTDFSAEHEQLLKRIDASDYDGLANKAHYFKGIAQNIGLINFLLHIMALEKAARQADSAACLQSVSLLNQTSQRLAQLRNDMKAA